ncbi:polycystic kidney disease 1 like 1-like [Thunnus albacares]|uniref:polycystic kidney disease 1 like 1-like n=1 Tax=Thunnus albacares TaxID=8236 RepID=UPI001CF6C165|nr:polycystic kidney disease 1 like 1-like [Thunnus albacares]
MLRVLYLPVGGGKGNVALYRTEGPFLHSISVSTSPDRVHAGKTFVLEVSGNLAGRPKQPTGIVGLGEESLSHVNVEFLWTTTAGQSSHHVSVLDDGSFAVSSDWILETSGKHEINISVSNPLSRLSSTLQLSVLQPFPDTLVISLLHGPLGVPSCIPFLQMNSHNMTVKAAYVGDPVTLQAYVADGMEAEFSWWFTHREKEENKGVEEERTSVKTACLANTDCLNSTMNWTFETEGVHVVSVNASTTSGWTQETIHIVVVRLAVSDLRVSVSGEQLSVGEGISVDVQLLTTMKQLLLLNLTLNSDNNQNDDDRSDLTNCNENISDNTANINKAENHTRKITNQENSNDHNCSNGSHGNINYDHNLSQHHNNIRCHSGTHSHPHPNGLIPLHLLHTSNRSSCRLHLHLHCRLPTTAGQYHLTASVLSTVDPSSVLLFTVLPPALMVYERIRALRPSGSWMSVVLTQTEFSLEVVSCVKSKVVWTFSLDDAVVINRTTENWNINVSLPIAGSYNVTVKAFNPVSWASFHTHILVQDPVGELVLKVPSVITTNRKHSVLFSVTAGSNVTVSLLVNATVLYRNSNYAAEEEAAVVLFFDHTGTVVIELQAENRVSSQNKSATVRVEGKRKPSPQVNPIWQPPTSQRPVHNLTDNAVRIHAAQQAYPTNTDITFLVVADVPDPVEFLWYFGDSKSARTTSKTITKRYYTPGRYDVVIVVSGGRTSLTSEVFPLVIQRAVKLNRLVHRASVLQNHTVTLRCRVTVGTDVIFLWSFGDGTTRLGQSTEQHIFHETGEFTVEVIVSNLVSSASLSSHIFVVDQPCQPPPVKNMGPLKLQVRRYEVIHLGVTYETEVGCDISGGLHYTWTLFDSAGQVFPLTLTNTHRQSLILPSHLLHYDTYTAIARVQVVGSVVYSNYSVRVQVIPSPPVASIQGGTNVFINIRNTTVVTLDGQRSYNPDFPMNPVSFSWACKPVSSITGSCFNQHVTTSSSVLTFPASFLKHNFDQFRFTLTVSSGEHSASTETFLTVTSNVIRKVAVYCPQCRGDQMNWDQSFSVSASCEDCDVSQQNIQYTWSLYLVNASSKPVTEVPFCYTVDLSAPSTISEGPATSPQTPGTSTLHPPAADASHYTRTVPLSENASETAAKKQNPNVTDSETSLKRNRNTLHIAGLTDPEPLLSSSPVNIRTAESGEEPIYHPLGEFLEPLYSSTEYLPLALDNGSSQGDVISEFPIDSDSSTDWEFSFPVLESGDVGDGLDSDYDVPFLSTEEGDPGISAGRPTGVDDDTFSPEDDSVFDPASHVDEGSNLVDSRPSMVIQEPTLLDLPRDPVDRALFESYTYTGISSPLLSFRPFSLRPGSRYMLGVTAKSQSSFLGRTQIFLKTNSAPKGMTCQVQPIKGSELYTHFSIFCTSGKEDLLYEYSFSVGNRPPRILYQGRDFQYYFSLPSGDRSDDNKVTIYTKIRSSTYGTATKPCPVTVQVQPSFLRDSSSHHDPDLELSESGLKNLSALVQLGNSVEIRNYISLLSSILNRLSMDTEANTHAQRRIRNILICTVCELESSEQVSMVDSIYILNDLLQVTSQVTLASARRVRAHIQAISEQFSESSVPVWYHLDQKTLNSLVTLLSYSLQAAVTGYDFTTNSADITQEMESDSHTGENIRNAIADPNGCISDSSSGVFIKTSISTKQVMRLVDDILQTASDLMLKYILFSKIQEHRVNTSLMSLYVTYQNQTSTVISSDTTTFYMPPSLIQLLFVGHRGETESRQRQPCVLSLLTELPYSPYTLTRYPGRLSGPVVDLSLYECSTRRKIPVRTLFQPIDIKLQQPPRNESSVREFVLLRSQINYHSFNITQEHLQQAVQLSVVFAPPPNKTFPIMLLFRMFERPTPSMHHLHRIHRWKSNSTRITLPPSYLHTPGVCYLALLNADFAKPPRHNHLSSQVNYSLTADSSLCLSWNGHQGAWTHIGCRTHQADTNTTVNCSCHQLRPLTVVQQQIQSSHDTVDLDPFLSVSSDVTVLCVLVLCVCLYVPGLVVCRRADVVSEENQRVHYLTDNSLCDPYLYAVTIHTGLYSAASMSAKVYIVLCGEDEFSQTRELQVPGCILFRRNSQATFILSAATSLGAVRGVHIWHDNSGPSPNWYLKLVEVSEVNRGHVKGRAWLFVGQCWLAVNKGDGQVERTLRVCNQGIGFAKMLCLKLSDYLADLHTWISVCTCPCPGSFTRTQRLSVCLLLLLGYECVSAVIISKIDEQLPLQLGMVDVSAVSVTTGVLSVVAVLPAAIVISFLFRLRKVKLTGSGVQYANGRKFDSDCFDDALSVNNSIFEPSWSSLQQWAQEAWRKKHQDTDWLSMSTRDLENKDTHEKSVIQTDVVIRKEDALSVESSTGPALQNSFLITDGNKVDQGRHRKELDSVSESGRFHGTQKDNLSGTKEKDPSDGGFEDDRLRKAAWSGHSGGSHIIDTLRGRQVRSTSQWCQYLAWALCLLLSLICLVLSAVLGLRFSSSKVLLWIHSVFFSLLFCILLIQPAVILAVAVTVSLWYRRRPDFHSFSSITDFEIETSILLSQNGANQPEPAFLQERCSYLKKLLGVRQRARYLRLVRPPTPAELRRTRGRKRRETLICKTLRDFSVCVSMLFLMMCITYGSSFSDHYHVNKAVRKQFLGSQDNEFISIQKHDDWWRWTQTSLLNLLYKNASDTTKFDVIQQSHILIGEPILWKMEISSSFQDQLSFCTMKVKYSGVVTINKIFLRGTLSVFACAFDFLFCSDCVLFVTQVSGVTLVPECLHLLSGSRASTYPQSDAMGAMGTPSRTCGHPGCYLGPSATVSLGHTKSDALFRLKLLRSCGWLGRQTVALKVQFTLYSPAPNLFSSVTLLAEQSPIGALLPSAKVQSVRLNHTPSVWDYVVMVCQLLFLLLSLLHLCLQVYTAGQQGLMGYCRTPCNWLEVILLTVIMAYYVHYIYHSMVIMEVVELLQRHNHRGHVDVSPLATWEQYIRALRGVMLFLLTMRCVSVLGVTRTSSTSATLFARSLSSLIWPMISGLILLVALSCAGNLLFVQSSWAFSSLPRSLQTLLCHYRGLRAVRGLLHSGHDFLYYRALYLSCTVVWTAVMIGAVSSLVRRAKRSQSRNDVLTMRELSSYIKLKVSEFTGQHKPTWTGNSVETRTYYLEEFESLVDELLFRLNALSNSLHHTLPPKVHFYREDSPVMSLIQEPSNMDSQSFVRTHMTEQTMVNDHTDVSDHGETPPAPHLLRSQLELKILQLPAYRGQRTDSPSSDNAVASDNSKQSITRSEKHPKSTVLQPYFMGQNCLSESASPTGLWMAEYLQSGRPVSQSVLCDVLEMQSSQHTKTSDSCRFSRSDKCRAKGPTATQTTHTEVVVEVLVHEEPDSV